MDFKQGLFASYKVFPRGVMGFLSIIYVNKTNRDLLLFLQSFEFQDDTLTFNKNKKLPFKPLYNEFNRIIENFKKVKLEKEMEQQYFQ